MEHFDQRGPTRIIRLVTTYVPVWLEGQVFTFDILSAQPRRNCATSSRGIPYVAIGKHLYRQPLKPSAFAAREARHRLVRSIDALSGMEPSFPERKFGRVRKL
jgi:hypothetical protein